MCLSSVLEAPVIINRPSLRCSSKSLSFLFIVKMLYRRSFCPNGPNVSLCSSSSSLMLELKLRFCLDIWATVSRSSFITLLLSSPDSCSSTTLELNLCKRRCLRCLVLPGVLPGVIDSLTLCRPSELPRASKLQSIPLSRLGSMWNCYLLIGLGSSLGFLGGVWGKGLSPIFFTWMQGLSTFYCWSKRIRDALS